MAPVQERSGQSISVNRFDLTCKHLKALRIASSVPIRLFVVRQRRSSQWGASRQKLKELLLWSARRLAMKARRVRLRFLAARHV